MAPSSSYRPAAADELSAYEMFRADLGHALARLKERLLPVAAVFAVIWLACIVAAFVWPKTYRGETILVPVSANGNPAVSGMAGQFSSLASLAGIRLGGEDNQAEALALLQSRGFIESFIKDEQLLPVLFAKDWDAQSGKWRKQDPARVPVLWNGYDRFRKRILHVKQDKLSGVVTVSVDWRDRFLAAKWANELVRRLNAAMRQRTMEDARKSLRFLDAEMKATNVVGLQEAISRLMEAQMRTIMLASVREDYSFNVVDEARPAHPRDVRWPDRLLLVVGGLLLAGFVSVACGLLLPQRVYEFVARRRTAAQSS